ncbi:NAD kinase [Pusillimonas sp. CC-YST705]|uniref:NAD kinase n=1 Tax=Mesopusillimonas faecipullorum TaxID=2755040 RepID=A0ABS8C8G1_9BURK|nr:NAD kinase [Mesopusillimonas faecipullorum]MCB5362318.1 NAD kinase [Mesopusillimonas faecipullorum]
MHFKTVALIGRHQDSGLVGPLRAMIATLQQAGCSILVEAETAHHTRLTEFGQASYEQIGETADLAVVMGGDGTMLGAGRMLAPYRVPLIGINHGRLGFITDIPLHNATDALSRVIKGHYDIEERMLLEGRIVRDGQTLFSSLALNDVVINRAGRGGMIELRVELDGSFMYSQRSDGLIISTPTGSTAYAMSANGPIVHPRLNSMLLVPVAPQTLSHRPILIPDNGLLSITLATLGRVESGASVHFDMQTWSDSLPGDRIDVRRASSTIRLIHPTGYSFFSTLRQKLQWNRMPQLSEDSE